MDCTLPALEELPVLGVGLSLSFGMRPDPVALAQQPGGPSFVEYAGAVQPSLNLVHTQRLADLGVPVLFHPSCLNLCGPDANPPALLAAVQHHLDTVDSAWLAQDIAACFVGETPGYSIQLGYFVPPVLNRDGLALAIDRVREVTAAIDRPLLLEPAPVTFQLGDMSIFEWLGELSRETDCGLLLDAGHVVSHQLALGQRGLTEGLDLLPLDRVVEVHLAGGVIEPAGPDQLYIDAHDLPVLPEVWTVFDHLLRSCPQLKAVCLECEGAAAQSVLPMLARVRERTLMLAANPHLRARVRAQEGAQP